MVELRKKLKVDPHLLGSYLSRFDDSLLIFEETARSSNLKRYSKKNYENYLSTRWKKPLKN